MNKKLFFFFLVLCINNCFAPYMTISQSGLYTLGDDVSFAPTSADSAIIINASDVVLDLGQRIITQTNFTSNVNGIVVNAGFSNITIKNGALKNFSGSNVLLNAGCSLVTLENILINSSITTRAIDLGGTLASPIKNVQINNCKIIGCTQLTTVLTLTQCINTTVNNCIFNQNICAGSTLSVIRLESCQGCQINNAIIKGNSSSSSPGTFIGIELNSTGSCIFNKCIIQQNIGNQFLGSGAGIMKGIVLNSATSAQVPNALNLFYQCKILENTAFSSGIGIELQDNALQNTFVQCEVVKNQTLSGTLRGIRIAPTSTGPVIENLFSECIVNNNSSTTGTDAFFVDVSDFGSLIRCSAGYNSASAGICAGLTFSTTGGNRWSVVGCQFICNVGNSAANSFGVQRVGGSNNLFAKVIAFNNSSTQANQLSGVASVATIGSPQSSNMNSPTGDWSNLPVAT